MILGLGIDSIEIDRFSEWHAYPHKKLSRILSASEIKYCLECPAVSAERFAVRFAAREAFFKAWNSAFPDSYLPFLTCCTALSVIHNSNKAPLLHVNWNTLGASTPLAEAILSLTHTRTVATACVALHKLTK